MARIEKLAFSLIELLVVVAIISILTAILLPALVRSRKLAQGMPDVAKMKQLYEATIMYISDENDAYPITYNLVRPYTGSDAIFASEEDTERRPLKDGNRVSDPFYATFECPNITESSFKMSFGYLRNISPKDSVSQFQKDLSDSSVGLFADPWVGDESNFDGIPPFKIGLNCGLNIA